MLNLFCRHRGNNDSPKKFVLFCPKKYFGRHDLIIQFLLPRMKRIGFRVWNEKPMKSQRVSAEYFHN